MQDQATTLTKPGEKQLTKFSKELQILAEAYGWGNLIDQKKFDQTKALQAVRTIDEDFLNNCKPATVQEALSSEAASMAVVRWYCGEVFSNAILHKLIYELTNYFNVGKGLNSQGNDQVPVIAELIMEEYHFLTVADIRCCFRMAMKSKFGVVFDRLDGAVILEWLNKYDQLRTAATNKAQEEKQKEYAPPTAEQWAEILKKNKAVFDKWLYKTEEKTKVPSPKKYQSIEHYCQVNEIDFEEYKNQLIDEWMEDYTGPDDKKMQAGYLISRKEGFLNELNAPQ